MSFYLNVTYKLEEVEGNLVYRDGEIKDLLSNKATFFGSGCMLAEMERDIDYEYELESDCLSDIEKLKQAGFGCSMFELEDDGEE